MKIFNYSNIFTFFIAEMCENYFQSTGLFHILEKLCKQPLREIYMRVNFISTLENLLLLMTYFICGGNNIIIQKGKKPSSSAAKSLWVLDIDEKSCKTLARLPGNGGQCSDQREHRES